MEYNTQLHRHFAHCSIFLELKVVIQEATIFLALFAWQREQ